MDRTAPSESMTQIYLKSLWLITLVAVLLCAGETAYGFVASSSDLLQSGLAWSYDVLIYGISALSFGRAKITEKRAAYALAAILAVGGAQGFYDVGTAIAKPMVEDAKDQRVSSVIDVLGSLAEAAALLRFRGSHDPIVAASWLSARNSALIIALESAITLVLSSSGSQWPENLIDTLDAILIPSRAD